MEAYLRRVVAEALSGEGEATPGAADAAAGVHLGAWCGGRATFANCRLTRTAAPGDWLGCLAALKESSAAEYDRMAEDLRLHSSPRDQIKRAEVAARDEWEHFELLCELAKAKNMFVCRAPTVSTEPRDLYQLARDNMTLGLVRESFSACVALYQVAHMSQCPLRSVFRHVARDAAKHLRFSVEVNHWLRGQLSPARCRALGALKREETAHLAAQLGSLTPEVQEFFSLPSIDEGRSILRSLASEEPHRLHGNGSPVVAA